MNPFYVFQDFNVPYTLARSGSVDASLQAIEVAFDAVHAYTQELVTARQGQASLLANLNRYILPSVGLPQDLLANGFRIKGLPDPVAFDEPATKRFAEGLAFATALPAQPGNAGNDVTTDGTTAIWSVRPKRLRALSVLNFIGY